MKPTTMRTVSQFSKDDDLNRRLRELEANARAGVHSLDTSKAPRLSATDVHRADVLASDGETVRCDPSAAGFNVKLPRVSENKGATILVLNVSSSTNTITIVTVDQSLISGASTKTITTAYGARTLYCDGESWWVVGSA